MKKYWLLILSIILGFALRVYNLSGLPNGLTWDEAALGYNAFSILKTGKDEFGATLPLIFKSFGDYKPGLYIYLAVPAVAIFGLSEFAVRLPSVIFGVLGVLAVFLLVKELLEKHEGRHLIASFAALSLSISPWHVHFSRGAWEVNVFSTLLVFGLYFYIRFLRQKINAIPAITFAILSFLTYQAAKMLTPLNYLLVTILFYKEFFALFPKAIMRRVNLVPIALAAVFSIWFFTGTLFGPAGNRLARLSIFGYRPEISSEIKVIDQNNPLIYNTFHSQSRLTTSLVFSRYLYHFSPEVLFYEGSVITERGHIPSLGILNPIEILWIIAGLVFLASIINYAGSKLILLLLVVSPIPASMTLEEFTTVRSHFLSIPLAILSGMGIYLLFKKSKFIFLGIFAFYLVICMYMFDIYFNHTNKIIAKEYNYGYKEVMNIVNQYPKNTKLIFTDVLGQPYIYYLFYTKYDPSTYQAINHFTAGGVDVGKVDQIDQVEFRQFSESDIDHYKDAILVGMKGNVPDTYDLGKPVVEKYYTVDYPDGTSLFRIIKTRK